MPSASAASSTPAGDRGRRQPAVLEAERELGAHRAHHDLGLGILEQRADRRGQLARAVLARVQSGRRLPGRRTAPPWKCGTSPLAAREQRRLAGPRRAGDDHQLAGLDLEARPGRARAGRARIGVGDVLEREHAHRDPPPSANGTSAPRPARPPPRASRRPADVQRRIGGEPRGRRRGPDDRQREDADRRARERQVVARPRSRVARRPARRPVAAHLERGGDVERAVQRRRRWRRASAPPATAAGPAGSAGRRRAAASLGRGSAPSAWRASPSAPSGNETRRNRRSTSSGSTAAVYSAAHRISATARRPRTAP